MFFKKTKKQSNIEKFFVKIECTICHRKRMYHRDTFSKLRCRFCENPIPTGHLTGLYTKNVSLNCDDCRKTNLYSYYDTTCIECGSIKLRTKLSCIECKKSVYYTWSFHSKKPLPECYNCQGKLKLS